MIDLRFAKLSREINEILDELQRQFAILGEAFQPDEGWTRRC